MLINKKDSLSLIPFHVVSVSPWPILVSFSLLIFTIGAVVFFNSYASIFNNSSTLLIIGFLSLLVSTFLWFKDIIIETVYLGEHTKYIKKGLTQGFYLFIVTEIFFFVGIFWSFFHSSLSPTVEIGSNWPPIGIETINPFELPFLNTILLLSSGASITWGHHALLKEDRVEAIKGFGLTLIFAILFTLCQYIEYSNANFTISDGIYGTIFYFATGTHSIHVIIGTLFIALGFIRIINYELITKSSSHVGIEAAILYWHFVDIVWIFVFICIYWWGN